MTSGSCTLRPSVRWALYTFIHMRQNLSRTQLWPEYKLSEEMERETAVLSANRVQGWPNNKNTARRGKLVFIHKCLNVATSFPLQSKILTETLMECF